MSYLMESYDREVRPVYNASKAVEVRVGITLTQIFDMVIKLQGVPKKYELKQICGSLKSVKCY